MTDCWRLRKRHNPGLLFSPECGVPGCRRRRGPRDARLRHCTKRDIPVPAMGSEGAIGGGYGGWMLSAQLLALAAPPRSNAMPSRAMETYVPAPITTCAVRALAV